MSASFKIDQAGLAAGTADLGRRDGLATGAVVTLTHTGGVFAEASFRLLSVPSADTTAIPTLVRGSYQPASGVCVYSFTPTAGARGSYLIEELVDGQSKRLTLAVLTPNLGIEIPAWNAQADPTAHLAGADGAGPLSKSDQNAPTSRYASGDPRGDFPALEAAFLLIDAASLGSSGLVVRKNSGADVGTRPRLNLIEGSNVALTVADDPGDGEVDVTIAATVATTVRKNSGADVGTRPRLNLIEGSGVTLTVNDDGVDDEVEITIAAAAAASTIVVRKNSGADVGTRPRLNLIEGANVTLTVADDAGDGEVDITIAAAGGATPTLDAVYNVGAPDNALAINATQGTISLANATDTTDLLTLARTFAGAGSLVLGTMGASTTGDGISLTQSGAGKALYLTGGGASTGPLAHVSLVGAGAVGSTALRVELSGGNPAFGLDVQLAGSTTAVAARVLSYSLGDALLVQPQGATGLQVTGLRDIVISSASGRKVDIDATGNANTTLFDVTVSGNGDPDGVTTQAGIEFNTANGAVDYGAHGFSILLGNGGARSASTSGVGGGMLVMLGAGGAGLNTTKGSEAAPGGAFELFGATGGAAAASPSAAGGVGSYIYIEAGAGGASTGSEAGGDGGGISLVGQYGGNSASGAGGNGSSLFFTSGPAGTCGAGGADGGDIWLGLGAGQGTGRRGAVRLGTTPGTQPSWLVPFTNKSGGALAVGDVVCLDYTTPTADAVNKNQAGTSKAMVGVIVIGGAADATVWVAMWGRVAVVTVDADPGGSGHPNIAIGDHLTPSAVNNGRACAGGEGYGIGWALGAATTDGAQIPMVIALGYQN